MSAVASSKSLALSSILQTALARWTNRPDLVASDVFGFTPWARQAEMMLAVAQHRRVAVRSGHKVGKSRSAATLAYWWLMTRPGGRVVMTSGSNQQVRIVLWREVRALHAKAKVPLGGDLHLSPSIGLQYPDGREIIAFTTDKPDQFSGISGEHVLFLVDEAQIVDPPLFEVIEGNLAGGGRIVLFGNPTQSSGTFYDAFHTKRAAWHLIHISSEESPNVVTGTMQIPGLATREWVAERLDEWGEMSPMFQVRVRGEFPSQSENAIIGLLDVEQASNAEVYDTTSSDGPLVVGVDVARFGSDDSVIWPVRGKKALSPTVIHGQDTIQVAGKTLEVVRALRSDYDENRPLVQVDVIGVGAGVYDQLAQAEDIDAVAVNVSEAPRDPDHYANRRAEAWFSMAQWLREGGVIPQDPRLEAELVAPTYKFDLRGRYVVEPKEAIKARLGRSPDRAEALMLAVAPAPEIRVW